MNISESLEANLIQEQQNKMLIETYKRKNEDLQQRLQISEKIRLDLQQSIKDSNQQDQFFHSQQVRCFNEQLEKEKSENNLLSSNLKSVNSQNENLKNKIIFFENSKRVQDQKLLDISSQCFKKSFSTIDEMLTFMLTQPKHYDEEHQQNIKIQQRLLKKIKNEKSQRKKSEFEIQEMQSLFERKTANYEAKIDELHKLNKELQNQINTISNDANKAILSLQTKIATSKKPRLFFYRESSITIPTHPQNTSQLDDLLEKVNISNVYLKDMKSKNKKLEKTVLTLTGEIKGQKEEMEKMEKELKTTQMLKEEGEKQLKTLRSTFDTKKDDRIQLKKKIKKQKQLIDSQVENIQTLHKTVSNLESKLNELKIQIVRVQNEKEDSDQNADFDLYSSPNCNNNNNNDFNNIASCNMNSNSFYDPTAINVTYTDCYTSEIPSILEAQIKSIIFNRSLQWPSKLKMTLKTVCLYYEDKVRSLTQEKNNIQQTLSKYTSCFTDFVPKFTALVLNKHFTVSSFIEDPSLQGKMLAILRRKCENANEFPCIKSEAITLTDETTKLQKKARKHRKELGELRDNINSLVNSNQEKAQTIMELQTKTKYLQRKYNEAQSNADRLKKEFLQKLTNSKNETEAEYEKVINHLKKQYNDQRNTINELSAQLALNQIS